MSGSQTELFFLRAQAALERGEFQLAEVNFAQVVHLDPNNARAMILLLYAQLKRRPTLPDHSALDTALRLAPRDPEVLRTAAKIFILTDKAGRAIEMLERAKAAAPNDADVQAELASAYLTVRERSSCEAALKEALRLDPSNKAALSVRSAFARTFFDAQPPQAPGEAAPRPTAETIASQIGDGRAAMTRGDTQRGYWLLREAARTNPSAPETREALAAALSQRFPLYGLLARLSKWAIQYRAITSFVLVYALARLAVMALGSGAPWPRVGMLVGAEALVGVAALVVAPMPIVDFALRWHPISRQTRTRSDQWLNLLCVVTALSGGAAVASWPIVGNLPIVLVGGFDFVLLGVGVLATAARKEPGRSLVAVFAFVAWIAANVAGLLPLIKGL